MSGNRWVAVTGVKKPYFSYGYFTPFATAEGALTFKEHFAQKNCCQTHLERSTKSESQRERLRSSWPRLGENSVAGL